MLKDFNHDDGDAPTGQLLRFFNYKYPSVTLDRRRVCRDWPKGWRFRVIANKWGPKYNFTCFGDTAKDAMQGVLRLLEAQEAKDGTVGSMKIWRGKEI